MTKVFLNDEQVEIIEKRWNGYPRLIKVKLKDNTTRVVHNDYLEWRKENDNDASK